MNDKSMLFIVPLLAVLVMGLAATSYAEFPSPLKQIQNGTDPNDIQCNDGKVHVIRDSGRHACVKESTAERMGWEIIIPEIPAEPEVELLEFSVAGDGEFVHDGREFPDALQRRPPPFPWYDVIMNSEINPHSIENDRVQLSSVPHEKYSVKEGVGFYIEDWLPSHVPDGYRLLYADNECHPSGDCNLRIWYLPTTFVLHQNVTNDDVYFSDGFKIGLYYSPQPLDEMEDIIEMFEDQFNEHPGNYGLGHVDMTRDGKAVYAYEGGNAWNFYRATLAFHPNENTSLSVTSDYLTLEEIKPIFASIANE